MNRPASVVTAIFLFAIAAGHLLRIITGVTVVANDITIPMWPSMLAIIGPSLLALWLLKERKSG